MKTKCVLLLAVVLGPAAWADDATTLTVGLRAWSNTWSTWDVYPPTAVAGVYIPGASENFSRQDKAVLIPSVSLRRGDWLLSASRFVKTRYRFDGNEGPFTSQREETDFHAGYYLLPTLAVSLGHKSVEQAFTGGTEFKYGGPILGVLASAPLTRGFSLYGNVGYGRVKGRFPVADASGSTKFDADYWLGEAGLAYSFEGVAAAKAMTLTLGYRSQVLATQGFRIALSPTTNRPTELRDTTEGLALGLSLPF